MRETRTLSQVLIHALVLNPMREKREYGRVVAWSDDKDRLLQWYNSKKVMPYTDVGAPSFECHGSSYPWHKVFAKGSLLEWYNPMIHEDGHPDWNGHGILSEWILESDLDSIPNGNRIY